MNIDFTKLKLLGTGRNRKVYLLPSGRNVIKVPINEQGIFDNWKEFDIRRRPNRYDGINKVYAMCRMVPGTKYLIMEYLKPEHCRFNEQAMPPWVEYIDSFQVGRDRNNRLKAYDYADQ